MKADYLRSGLGDAHHVTTCCGAPLVVGAQVFTL